MSCGSKKFAAGTACGRTETRVSWNRAVRGPWRVGEESISGDPSTPYWACWGMLHFPVKRATKARHPGFRASRGNGQRNAWPQEFFTVEVL